MTLSQKNYTLFIIMVTHYYVKTRKKCNEITYDFGNSDISFPNPEDEYLSGIMKQ
jgi:hypothetical protein